MKALVQQMMAAAIEPIAKVARGRGILPPISRDAFRSLIQGEALELGPFDCPFISGPHVSYYDILDQDQLRVRAVEHSRNPDGCPVIHYTGDLGAIDRTFDAVFSSHVIEHAPDLIGHLKDVAALLADGGAYYLLIPDKRFCFDHFLPPTPADKVYTAQGRDRPSIESVANHLTRRTHNRAMLHWLGFHGRPSEEPGAFEEMERARRGEYIDVHQWAFTPSSFGGLMENLGIFKDVTIYDTAFGDLEFMAILKI